MNRRFSVLLAATAFTGGLNRVALAQNAPQSTLAPQPQVGERKSGHYIRMQNVPPSIMAWWLDPARHEKPIQFRSSLTNRENNPLILDKADPKMEVPPLPAGIDRFIAIDPQNALLAFGTDAAIAELEKTVALLDQPLRQVEIEAQFVQISPEDMRQIGVSVSSDPKKRYSVFPLNANDLARVAALKAGGKAKIVSAPRVFAINNLTATLGSKSATAGFIDIKMRGEKGHAAIDLTEASGKILGVDTNSTFTARPILNADNSIRLQLAPARFLQLSEIQMGPAIDFAKPAADINPYSDSFRARVAAQNRLAVLPLRVLEGALTETTVQDGQTIALTGYTSDFFTDFVRNAAKPTANVVILVTARIVRRADDNIQTVALKR